MRVAVIGAYGFIGSHVARCFLDAGHEVAGFGRDLEVGRRTVPSAEWHYCDLNCDTDTDVWADRLTGCEVVVNCAGVLQRTARDDPSAIHSAATIALFEGARKIGVRRVVHVSALGADEDVETDYSRSKLAADSHLREMDLDWVILRPSLVIARDCFGGTGLMRMLAGLPGIVPLPGGTGLIFQPVGMDDLTAGITRLAEADAPARLVLPVTGPREMSLREIVGAIRNWLGFRPASFVEIPKPLFRPALLVGDLLGFLGAESAMRTTSFRQMEKANIADARPFAEATGIDPAPIETTLARHPATRADRRDARLAAPLVALRVTLAAFWILTGIITIAASPAAHAIPAALALSDVVGEAVTMVAIYFGAIADIVLGGWLLIARNVRAPCLAQIALSLGYLAALTVLDPAMWGDPLGVLLKTIPIMAATLVLASADERR